MVIRSPKLVILSVIIVSLTLLLIWPAVAAGPVDSPCAVDWRGRSFGELLPELAGQLSVPYILDSSVDQAARDVRVRLYAGHLTGCEAFRWLARSAGLEAVLIDSTVLIARPERLPAVWRIRGVGGRGATGCSRQGRRQQALQKRVDVHWADSPLSQVARDVSAGFGIDLIFAPAIVTDQPLITLEKAGADLNAVCEALKEQLQADCNFADGAVWVFLSAGVSVGGQADAPAGPQNRASGSVTSD